MAGRGAGVDLGMNRFVDLEGSIVMGYPEIR